VKYRSGNEIIEAILRSVRSGATKSQIRHVASLTFAQLKKYLRISEEKELIRFEDNLQLYLITQKGFRFMNAYDEIREATSVKELRTLTLETISIAPYASPKKAETFTF
jgi:predicted transcriptional regulator